MPKLNAATGQWEPDAPAQVPIVTPESLPQVTPGVSDIAPPKIEYPVTAPPQSIQRPPPPPTALQSAAAMTPEQLALMASRNPVTPGISQAQIDKMAQTGTYVAQAESRSVSGGNPEAYADITQIDQARREAASDAWIADRLQAQANLDNAQARAVAARQQAEVATAQQSEADTRWQKKWDAFQTENDPRNPDNQVDPGRLFRGPGIIGGILAAIGDAYSAKGAVLAHQSPPQSRVMQMVDNDLRAQQLNIMQRGQAANNKLSQLSREWGSLEAGKQALKVQQLQAIDAQLQATAAKTTDPAVRARIDADSSARHAAIDAETARLKAIYGGQETRQQQGSIMRPRAASGGGVNHGKYLDNLEKIRASLREDRKLDIEETKANASLGEQTQGRAQQAAKDLAAIGSSRQAAEEYYKSIGLQRDKSGKWVSGGDNPLRGPVDTARNATPLTASEAAREAEARRAIAVEAYGRFRSQGAINDEERKEFERQFSAGADAAARANALEADLEAREKALRAGAGTSASNQFNQAYRQESLRTIQRHLDRPYEGRAR